MVIATEYSVLLSIKYGKLSNVNYAVNIEL